jgi:hypothetical protein
MALQPFVGPLPLLQFFYPIHSDRLSGLVVRVPGYRSRGPGFDSPRYIFWEILSLERGPLSLVSTIEDLLEINNSGSGVENQEYGRGEPLPWPRDTLYLQKLALTSPTRGGRSVGIVRLRAKATEFSLVLYTVSRTPWTGDQPVSRPVPTRNHDPIDRASEDSSCLRPRGHCDRPWRHMGFIMIKPPYITLFLNNITAWHAHAWVMQESCWPLHNGRGIPNNHDNWGFGSLPIFSCHYTF